MLSVSQKEVQNLIETKLAGLDKDDALLFHISVERKLTSVDLWFQNVSEVTPSFIQQYGTWSTSDKPEFDINSFLVKMSAYIDAFFMSGKSTLDSYAHEIRSLYGLGGHTGPLYFDNVLDLLPIHNHDSSLNSFFSSSNIRNIDWFKDLNSYRRASAHESIIQIKPTLDFDYLTGQWKEILLKLPIDPTQRPLTYNGKNFFDTGNMIKVNLFKFIIEGYNAILNDILNIRTKIV
jgi:hypothetical protein